MKISIITVCYNAVSSIQATIESVINQNFENIEYIIIDGGSTDGTIDVIRQYEDKISFWISEPDNGIYDAMNKGIARASGDYVNFMNAGDKLQSDETLAKIFNKYKNNADIIYGDTYYIYNDYKLLFKPKPLNQITFTFPICHQSSFIKTALIKKCPYNTKYKSSADYDFFYNQYMNGKIFEYIPIVVSEYEAEAGISATQILRQRKESGEINGLGRTFKYRLNTYFLNSKFKCRRYFSLLFPHIISELRRKKLMRNGGILISGREIKDA